MQVQGVAARTMLVCISQGYPDWPLFPFSFLLSRAVHNDGRQAVSVTTMTPTRYRRPLMICAAFVALLSLAAVGAVMVFAFGGYVAPVWVTSTALYGLPVAFLLMVFLVLDSVAGRRRAGKSGGR